MQAPRWIEAVSGLLAGLVGDVSLAYVLTLPATGGCRPSPSGKPSICAGAMTPLSPTIIGPTPETIAIFVVLAGVAAAAVWHARTRARAAWAALWLLTAALILLAVQAPGGVGTVLAPSIALALVACASSLGSWRSAAG